VNSVRGVVAPDGSDTLHVVSRAEPGLQERLAGSVAALDARRLQRRFNGVEMSSIREVAERCPVRFGGEVRSQHRSSPGSQPMLRVTVNDGTGSAVAVFTGRSRILGLDAGRAVVLEGVAHRERGQLVIVNPAYTVLP
jgi:RecG-like helicase